MPQSGRTTVCKAICKADNYRYVDAISWVRSTFREQKPDEKSQQYEDEYHNWFVNRLKINPNLISENIQSTINVYSEEDNIVYVIDGIQSPRDLIKLFDYNKDYIVFLNHINNQTEYADYQNIGISVIRDYCFWLSSADLLPKDRWLELNYKIPGEISDSVRILENKNTIYIVKNINKGIDTIINLIKKIHI